MKHLLLFPILIALVVFLTSSNQITVAETKVPRDTIELSIQDVNDIKMKESAVALGIEFEHARRSYRQNSIADMYGNGVCVLDVDNDGFEDIITVAGQGTTRRYGRDHWWNTEQNSTLYLNHQGQYFEPIQLVEDFPIAGFGCTVGDLNHDGRNDVVIGDIGKLHLLINNGKTFTYRSQILNKNDWPTSLIVTDINQDNLNDIIVATLVDYRNDVKVGDQEYGYQTAPTINTSDYAGQSNIVLQAQAKGSLSYQKIELVGQQRTLNWLKLNNQQLLAVNGKGSNSVVQGLKHQSSLYDWLTFAAVQISPITVANQPHLLIANHGSRGIQLLDLDTRLNRAWSVGLTNQTIDASQSWANIIDDFNNDSFDDVFVATGYSSKSMNSSSRSQASSNFLLLQDSSGQFHQASNGIKPALSRSSRGAVATDFNNDGFVDLVVMNNNNFASVYQNQGNENHWLSFDCMPSHLCEGSSWKVQHPNFEVSKLYNKTQPYLSYSSSRVHFGLGDLGGLGNSDNLNLDNPHSLMTLTVTTSNGEQQLFEQLKLDNIYQVNLATSKIKPIEKPIKPSTNQSFESLFIRLLQSDNPISVLSLFDLTQAPDLLKNLHQYKHGLGQKLSTKNPNVIAAIGWLLTHSEQLNQSHIKQLIDLVIMAENRLFVDYLIALMPQLNRLDFCYLSEHLHYWFEEEEVLPETKLTILAPLLQQGLKAKQQKYQHNQQYSRLICAIDAASYAEQTTIGASILPLLAHQSTIVQASAVRALGRLKYAQGSEVLKKYCAQIPPQDLILSAECQISLHKLGIRALTKTKNQLAILKGSSKFMSLHSQSLLFDVASLQVDLAYLTSYQDSNIKEHRFLGYQALLLQQNYNGLQNKPDIVEFTRLAKGHYPEQIDALINFAINNHNPQQSALLPFISNQGLKQLFKSDRLDTLMADDLVKGLVAICKLRQSLVPLCKDRFAIKTSNKASNTVTFDKLSAEYLTALPKGQLYYLLNFSSKIKQRIIARQLAEHNHFELLHQHQLYRHIQQIDSSWQPQWLEAFLAYSFENRKAIDLTWLKTIASITGVANTASEHQSDLKPDFTSLYLAHLDNKREH